MRQVLDLAKDCGGDGAKIAAALLKAIETERKRCAELVRQLSALGEELKQEGLQTPNFATSWVYTDIMDGTETCNSKLHVRSGIRVIQGNV